MCPIKEIGLTRFSTKSFIIANITGAKDDHNNLSIDAFRFKTNEIELPIPIS